MTKHLSKSRYLSGLQCEKRLWLAYHDPAHATPPSRAQQHILSQGTRVGLLAQARFPNGVRIAVDPRNLGKNIAGTRAAIARGAMAIFEATFLYNQTYILADIITRNADGTWDLYEVKASTKTKAVHVQDLAVQHYVMNKTGYRVTKVFVMHLNKQYVCDGTTIDPYGLFTLTEVTSEVREAAAAVPANLHIFQQRIQQATVPDTQIGPHCSTPAVCPFKASCWEPYGKQTVFDIPRLSTTKQAELRAQQIIFLTQLPAEHPLSSAQRAYVDCMLTQQAKIDVTAIGSKLAELIYPLYFLDFETDNPAIPRFVGTRPYQQIPFQYSCHIMQADGSVDHRAYLHPDDSDPRGLLLHALLSTIGPTGSVIAYNMTFEKGVLQALAVAFPDHAEPLHAIVARLWDQLAIFKNHYAHPRFGSSNSIKDVLPVLSPTLTYTTLAVQNGAEAQADWNRMLETNDQALKARLNADLHTYCARDTFAMVEIHRVLQGLRQDTCSR